MLDLRLYILKNKVKPQNYSQTSSDDFRNINCNPNHFSLFQCTSLSWIKLWTWVSFIFVVLIGIEGRLANLTLLSWGDVFSCLGFHIHYKALRFKHMRLYSQIYCGPMNTTHQQCSRLKPSHEFHFEGLSNFNSSIQGLAQIQDVNTKI